MAFRSPLRTLLRVRSLREEIRYAELQRAQQAVAASAQQLATAVQRLRAIATQRIKDMDAGLTGAELQFVAVCGSEIAIARQRQEQTHKDLVSVADSARQAFLLQRREREVVQTLCERQEAEHADELDRRAQRELDDMFLRRMWSSETPPAHSHDEPQCSHSVREKRA